MENLQTTLIFGSSMISVISKNQCNICLSLKCFDKKKENMYSLRSTSAAHPSHNSGIPRTVHVPIDPNAVIEERHEKRVQDTTITIILALLQFLTHVG